MQQPVLLAPVVAGGQLLAGQQLSHGGHRGQQNPPFEGTGQQLGLGVGNGEGGDAILQAIQLGVVDLAGEHEGKKVDTIQLGCVWFEKSLLDQPRDEANGEGGDGPEEQGNGDPAVAGRIQPADVERADPQATAVAQNGLGSVTRGQDLALGHHGGGFLGGDVRPLALAAHPGLPQTNQRGAGRVGRGVEESLGVAHPHRGPVGIAAEKELAGGGLHDEVAGGPIGLGTAAPERGDGHQYQSGVDGLQARPVQAQPFGFARIARFEQHVGGGHQVREALPVGRLGQVQHDRLFGPVKGQMAGRAGAQAPGASPARRFHGNDLGPELGQHHGGHLPPLVGQIQYPARC